MPNAYDGQLLQFFWFVIERLLTFVVIVVAAFLAGQLAWGAISRFRARKEKPAALSVTTESATRPASE